MEIARRCIFLRCNQPGNGFLFSRTFTARLQTAAFASLPKTMPLSFHWTQLSPERGGLSSSNVETSSSPGARSSHGMSMMSGKKIVLYGGEHVIAREPIDAKDVCWVFDEDTKKWDPVSVGATSDADATPVTPPPRIAHAQAIHQKTNTLYIFGGRDSNSANMNDLWKFDFESNTWVELQPKDNAVPEARSYHRMICIDDSLYVFGGCSDTGRLADLYRYDIGENAWQMLPSSGLRGRGGPNLISLAGGSKIGVIAGFAGEETTDGHLYDIANDSWDSTLLSYTNMRPRSVCVSGSFPSLGIAIVFGGEVNPSDLGHEGAGGFVNDILVFDEKTGELLETVESTDKDWPCPRGWADATFVDHGDGATASFYIFGGLTGDDENPTRLNDLWRLDIAKSQD